MNRSLWKSDITKNHCPQWLCPNCDQGKIVLVPNSLVYEETVESIKCRNDPEFQPEWIEYSFVAWGQCTNTLCNQKFAIAGNGGVEPQYTSENGDWDYKEYFSPQYCFPMPHIIKLPKTCPDEIKKELKNAFLLFWLNRPACAGRIRVSLEILMDYIGIPKKRQKNNHEIELTLHERIDAYTSKNSQIGSQLMALKWLGNTGSHETDISKNDILDVIRNTRALIGSNTN